MDRARHIVTVLLLAGLLVAGGPLRAAADIVGEVGYARGVLTGQIEGEPTRILGRGESLRAGETLRTGNTGFALIELNDGTRMTLRPNSAFRIESVNTEKGEESAFMRLIKGGFRAITGFISKRRPGAFKVTTSVATIGIRGTEFDARLCEGDECERENARIAGQKEDESRVIGRVALLRGKASAVDGEDRTRALSTGAAVYESDRLQTGIQSIAVIAFNDESRVTMSPNTVFRIEQHRYRPESPKESNAFLRFVRGGLRLVTGLIGKLNRPSWRVGTPTATIGIRGTGFDLVCDGDCVDQQAAVFDPWRDTLAGRLLGRLMQPAFAQQRSGMYARVWQGEILLQYDGGNQILAEGQTAFMRNSRSAPVLLPDLPRHLRRFGGAPRPDKVVIRRDLFARADIERMNPGLYVNVRKGDVEVRGKDGSVALLGRGEASLTGLDGHTRRLAFVPPFQKYDDTPLPDELTPRMRRMIELFGVKGRDKKAFQCRLR
jgi:hypothetical protein